MINPRYGPPIVMLLVTGRIGRLRPPRENRRHRTAGKRNDSKSTGRFGTSRRTRRR